jgi:hypothetical protein
MTTPRRRLAIAGAALVFGGMGAADVAAMPLGAMHVAVPQNLIFAQWVYGPYGRPYWAGPYAAGPHYWARRRFYNNHFGPGAGKERNRTRLDYCISKPERC